MQIKLRPLGDRVLVRFIEGDEKVGSIIIPDTAKEKPTQGIVEAVGHGKMSDKGNCIPMHVKPGEKIIFGRYAGTEVRLGDRDYMVLRETEILAIL